MATNKNKTNNTGRNIVPRRQIEKFYTTEEVARLFGKTTRTIRRYARQGALVRIYVKGQPRAIGYTAESVRALVEGRCA